MNSLGKTLVFPRVLLGLLLALASAPAFALDCSKEPKFMKEKNATCDHGQSVGLTEACSKFKEAMAAAINNFRSEMAGFCAFLQASGSKACPDQECSQVDESKMTAEAKARLQKIIDDQRKYEKKVQECKEILAKEVQDDKDLKGDSDNKKGIATDANKVASALKSSITIKEQLAADDLPQEQGNLANDMIDFEKEIKQEISRLSSHSGALGSQSAETGKRGKAMGADSSSTPAADKQNSPAPQNTQPQQASKSGGGSGGDQAASSTPSNQSGSGATSPTPDGTDAGTAKRGDDRMAKNDAAGTGSDGGVDTSGMKKLDPASPGDTPSLQTSVEPPPASADGSSRDELVERLRNRLNSGASRGLASSGGSGTGAGGESAAAAKADAAKARDVGGGGYSGGDSSAMGGGGGGGGGGGDEVLSPFGKPLDDPKFSLAGSETDASVKNIIGALNPGSNDQASRDPASVELDGIGEKNSVSLFERLRSCHDRCQRRGCVSGLLKIKRNGG
jgi:hypothetical protein